MSRISLAGERGITLIELLAVMSIIGILAVIVVPAVTGTTSESRDVQGLQDVTSVQSAAIEFFTAQNSSPTISRRNSDIVTSIVDPLGGSLNAPEPVTAIINNAWPEKFVTDVYESELPVSGSPTEGVVRQVTLLDSTGRAITEQQILELFTAIDFDVLTGDTPVELDSRSAVFLLKRPANVKNTIADGLFRSFLWLFEKKSTAASAVEGDARQVVVFQLVEARPVGEDQFELVYEPLTPFTVEPPEKDTTAPTVAGVSLSPDTVDFTGGPTPITVTLELSDDLSGIAGWIVELESPSGDLLLVVGVPALVSGTLLDGTFQESVVLPAFSEIGAWTVKSASVTDQSGNVTSVSGAIIDLGNFDVILAAFEPNLGSRLNLLDDDSASVPLGFAFPFLGVTYTDVFVNSNGTLTFGGPNTDFAEDATVFTSALQPTIAPFWDDLNPGVSLGQSFPLGEVDIYSFVGAAGTTITAEIDADRSGSTLDSVLSLLDDTGAVLAENDDSAGLGRDSRVEFVLPSSGLFFLRVRDSFNEGGQAFSYTLTLEGASAPVAAGGEIEPNDTPASATPIAFGASISGVIDSAVPQAQANVFVNSLLPGRLVVTWNGVPEAPDTGSNTVQAFLFDSGKIQVIYNGISSDDAIVGVSPGTTGDFIQVDYSADAPLSTSGTTGVYEEFDGPIGPDSTGEDLPGVRPFDLDDKVLTFVPNPAGGYTVSIFDLTP